MKVLYIVCAEYMDYLCDQIFHGFKTLLGNDVVDSKKLWYMNKQPLEVKKTFYGRGFTVYANLDDTLPEDERKDLTKKIQNRYYDLIVYGSVWRCLDYLDLVLRTYPSEKIVFLDGEDHSNIMTNLIGKGKYFKRELVTPINGLLYPIEFSVPKEKVYFGTIEKVREFSNVVPNSTSSYIYDREDDYYNDYRTSRFAITTEKNGWTTLRHYEILMNKCLPFFKNIENCPSYRLIKYPKHLCREINKYLYNNLKMPDDIYDNMLREAHDTLVNKLTTDKMASYILGEVL